MKGKILKIALTRLLFIGLLTIFGTAGYCDFADEEGTIISLGFIVRRFIIGIVLMLPLCIFYGIGGKINGNDGDF